MHASVKSSVGLFNLFLFFLNRFFNKLQYIDIINFI